MKFAPTPTHRRRLSSLLRRCSAGIGMTGLLISAPAIAQDSQGSQIERQLNPAQSGFNNPVQTGVGEAARGITQGQNFGEAVRSGVQAGVDQQFGSDRQYQQPSFPGQQPNYRYQREYQYRPVQPGQYGYQQQGQPIYRDQYGRQYFPQYRSQQYGNQFGGHTAGSSGRENVVTRFNLEGQPYRVRIDNRDGARLGISMTSEAEQVKIQNVARGSAAAAAGLRSGDIIVTANGRQINSPQDLIDIVDQRSPGDELDLTVKRDGGEQQTLTAKLQSFASDQRSMARPRMDGGPGMDDGQMDGGGNMQMINRLQQEVRQLSQQVEELTKTVESMSKEGAASGQANQDGQTGQATDAPAASSEEAGDDAESANNASSNSESGNSENDDS